MYAVFIDCRGRRSKNQGINLDKTRFTDIVLTHICYQGQFCKSSFKPCKPKSVFFLRKTVDLQIYNSY